MGMGFCFLCNKPVNPQETPLHRIPKNHKTRAAWIKFCKLNENVDDLSNVKLCSAHFTDQDYIDIKVKQLGGRAYLKPGTIPSIFKPTLCPTDTVYSAEQCGTVETEAGPSGSVQDQGLITPKREKHTNNNEENQNKALEQVGRIKSQVHQKRKKSISDNATASMVTSLPRKQEEETVRPRTQCRRAASKEALKQMQILLEDEDDTVEIPDDDVIPVPVVPPPKKKYKLTHRKSSDGNDREVLVLKSITPSITNHYVENNLELECWVEELEPCQKERNKKLEEEERDLQSKLDELIKACKGEVVYKGSLTTVIEVSEHVQKTIQAVQASHNKPPLVLNNIVPSPPPGYQLMVDPLMGLIVGAVPQASPTPAKQAKIQVATNLQAPVTPTSQAASNRNRLSRGKKQPSVVQQTPPPTPPAPAPVATRSLLNSKQSNKRTAPQPPPTPTPATRSRGSEPSHQTPVATPPVTRSREPAHQPVVATPPVTRSREPASQPVAATPPVTRSREPAHQATPTPPVTRSREPAHQPVAATPPMTRSRESASQPAAPTPPATRSRELAPQPPPPTPPTTRSRVSEHQSTPAPTPPVTRSRPGSAAATNPKPTESSVEGGLATGTNLKPKAIVDLTSDDGKPLPDSREVSFNKLQGKTYPSLVVVARPHLRVSDINSDRAKLDSKVKSVLMYAPTKFTEWLIQQGLVKSEQTCSLHSSNQLKLGMYSDVSKFPYSGGYVWISECCPQRFVSVFSGSMFEGSPHPPLVILKILYHWACQTNIQNVTQWVKVDNLYVKGMYTWLRAICTVALQTHIRQLGGPQAKVEVGVISLGTTSQDGNSRQVKVEVLGILETSTKLIRLRAVEPLADGDRNYKKRFSKILEPLAQWVHQSSIIVTDLTVDKATLHQMGFSTVIQTTSVDANNSNRTIMEYLRRIVPRMFQNTLSLLSRQIIQQFLDELVWREWFGTTSMQAFDNLVTHLAEQTRYESNQSLIVRLNRVALNPFKNWSIPTSSETTVPVPSPTATTSKNSDSSAKKRKRKEPEPQLKPPPPPPSELNRPPKSTSPDVPEQMVPLENYYYGTIDNYPPKTNVTLNLKCPFCKETYNNNIILMNHLFKHAHSVSKDGQMCMYCLTSVPTANDLMKHIGTAHPSETKHDNGFVCLICETQYMNPFVLGKHMSKEHCPSELPYQCGTCGYRCSNHKQAIDHFYRQHDNGPTIQCPFCLKSTTVFSSSRNIAQNMHYFIQHLQKHQRKQFARRCGKCNLWFVQKDVLKEHQTKMHASQRGKTGLVPWTAPRNGVMVPKSKMDKYPCDAEGINFSTLFYNVSKNLKCKECDGPMDSTKHFPSFESCQNPNCQYSTCCSNAMQEHNAKCNKLSQSTIPSERLPFEMFCICGYSSRDGNQMARHLTLCEKKSAYPSLSDAKSASVTHSMLDVLGLVRKPDEADKKSTPSRTARRSIPAKSDPEIVTLDDDPVEITIVKPERPKRLTRQAADDNKIKITETMEIIDLDDPPKQKDVVEVREAKKPRLRRSSSSVAAAAPKTVKEPPKVVVNQKSAQSDTSTKQPRKRSGEVKLENESIDISDGPSVKKENTKKGQNAAAKDSADDKLVKAEAKAEKEKVVVDTVSSEHPIPPEIGNVETAETESGLNNETEPELSNKTEPELNSGTESGSLIEKSAPEADSNNGEPANVTETSEQQCLADETVTEKAQDQVEEVVDEAPSLPDEPEEVERIPNINDEVVDKGVSESHEDVNETLISPLPKSKEGDEDGEAQKEKETEPENSDKDNLPVPDATPEDISNLMDNDQICPVNDEPKDSETTESLLSALGESDAKESSVNEDVQPMDYEDISNSGLDTLSAMETD